MEGELCRDRLFTKGLIENAVSHRTIRLESSVKVAREIDGGTSLLRLLNKDMRCLKNLSRGCSEGR